MRALISTLIITSLTISSAIAGVKEDVIALGGLAMGYEEAQSEGSHWKEIFVNYSSGEFGVDEDIEHKEYENISSTDEGVGFTSAKSAAKFSGLAVSFLEMEMEHMEEGDELNEIKAQIYNLERGWAPIVKRLEKAGVGFAYSGYGPGYCGISFTQMHVIDVKTKKVYTIRLSFGGEC